MDDITPTPKPNNPQQNFTAPPVPDSLEPDMPNATTTSPELETTTPASDVSVEPVSETVPVSAPADAVTDEPAVSEQVVTSAPIAQDAVKKKSAMPFVLIIVLLVVVGLATAAYLALGKTEEKAVAPAAQNTQVKAAEPNADGINESIDTSLNAINEDKDYNAAELNDTTLGL